MKTELPQGPRTVFRSIVFRLTILVAVIVLLFGSIGIVISVFNAKNQLTNVIQKQQLAHSEYISHHIDNEIYRSLSFFTNLANELSDVHSDADIRTDTEWTVGRHIPTVFKYGVILISTDGKEVIAESPILPGRKDLSFIESEWFVRAKTADQAIFSKPFRNRITQEPSIVFAAPVKSKTNEVVAVVAGIMALDQPDLFERLYTSSIGSENGILVISPEDELFVASNIPEMVLEPTPKAGVNHLHDLAMGGYRGVGVTTNADGVEELSAIAGIESTGWFVVVRMPVSEAYLPVKKLSKSLVMYNVLLALVIIMITTTALARMLSPLKKAATAVGAMAQGHLPLDKLSMTNEDEVGDLIEGFNSLVVTIDERTKNLETANNKLEKSIEEVKQLSGLLPICANCKKIRDDKGYWNLLESYVEQHSEASFSHGMCPDCSDEFYGDQDWYKEMKNEENEE